VGGSGSRSGSSSAPHPPKRPQTIAIRVNPRQHRATIPTKLIPVCPSAPGSFPRRTPPRAATLDRAITRDIMPPSREGSPRAARLRAIQGRGRRP
jgi:hypothetical protein